MMNGGHRRTIALALASLLAFAGLGVLGSAVGAGTKSAQSDPGINSAEALASANCDAQRKQIKLYFYAAPPCVKPWKSGADNGNATAQGVTGDTIKVVVLVNENYDRSGPNAVSSGFLVNQSTGDKFASPTDAIRDFNEVYKHVYETWGRKIEFEFVQSTSADEAAQRADAIAVAAKKPFAVLDYSRLIAGSGGGPIFGRALEGKVPVVIPSPSTDPRLGFVNQAKNVAEFIGKQLVGGKAEYAGQDDMKEQKRSFGVVYEGPTISTPGIDVDVFKKELAKFGGKVASEFRYDPGVAAEERSALAQEQAPTVAAKLKSDGVNNVVIFVDPRAMMPALLQQMTALSYFPEITITSFGYNDIDVYARTQDQEQMAHAFGVGWFTPWVQGFTAADTANFQWFWGKDKGTFSPGAYSLLFPLYNGVQLAGPNLTGKTFRSALQAAPGRGGYFTDSVTTLESKPTKPDEPSIRGGTLIWWNAEKTGPSQQLGLEGKGVFEFLDGGKRYITGKFPKAKKTFFDENNSIVALDAVPAGEVLPSYRCDGCPANGGGPTPSGT